MVFVTGDTHGDWINRLNVDSFPEQKEMTKDDYVIICGDFATDDNAKALEHIEIALMYMNKRVRDRYERNVLGTYEK